MKFETHGLDPLEAVINVRLTVKEKILLKFDAEIAGLSMSDLVRRRYLGKPIVATTDAVMIKELRRIGGLLKRVHTESDGAYSDATSKALLELKSYIGKLSHDCQED